MRRLRWLFPLAAAAAAWWWYPQWQFWLAHGTGSYNCPPAGCPGGSPHNYNASSGFLGTLEGVGLTWLGIGLGVWWHNQCHVGGCYWYARLTTDAGDRACWRHHPHRHLTHARLLGRHHAAGPGHDTGPQAGTVGPAGR